MKIRCRVTPGRLTSFLAVAIPVHLACAVCLFGGTPPWAATLLQISVCVMGMLIAARIFQVPGRPHSSWLLIPLALAPLWGLLQLLAHLTVYRFATVNAVVMWTCYLALFAIALETFGSSKAALLVTLRFLPLFAFVAALVGLLEHFSSPETIFWTVRITGGSPFGTFVDRDHFAVFAELLLPLAIWNAFDLPRRAALYTAAAATLFAAVIASGSRAGSLLALAEVIVTVTIAFFRVRSLPAVRSVAPRMIGAALVFSAIAGWGFLWNRLSTEKDPFANRREMLESAWHMARERPWTGFGMGTFQTVYPAYAVTDFGLLVDHAHNDWAEWAAEGGFPFALCLAAVALWIAPTAVRSIWGLGAVSAFAHAAVDFPFQIPALASIVIVLAAALESWRRMQVHGKHSLVEPEAARDLVLVLESEPAGVPRYSPYE